MHNSFRYFDSSPEAIRGLTDEVRLISKDRTLKIELFGELVALFELANEHPAPRKRGCR